jgi:hypothetical protein
MPARHAPTSHQGVFRYRSTERKRIIATPETQLFQASTFFHFLKGIKMNSNQKGGSSKQGSNQGGSKQSGNQGSSSESRSGSGSGTQGGTHEQHVEAGRQSHKNDGNKQSGNKDR